jgi:IclR family acetate operon transcriptional repressor
MPLTDHKARPRSPEDITTVMTTVESRYAAHVVPPADEFAMAGPLPQRSSIQSVERALAILEVLGGAHGPLRLGEVAQRCGINTSTCHHLLDTLVGRGYVSRAATGLGYRLGRQAWVLGQTGAGRHGWLDHALPIAQGVRDALGEATVLAAFQDGALVQLARLDTPFSRSGVPCTADLRRAAHAAAVGKAILAWLPEPQVARVIADQGLDRLNSHTRTTLAELANCLRLARRHGFALDDEEFALGVVSLACVLRGPGGEVLGAMGCCVPSQRASEARLLQLQQALRQGSLQLSRELAG